MTAHDSAPDFDQYLQPTNWGRWGQDDQIGALNLVDPAKRLESLKAVRTGEALSLSRPFPTTPGVGNPIPAQHYTRVSEYDREQGGKLGGGAAVDFYGTAYHGVTSTHIDALCHVWDENGMYNGRDPKEHVGFDGATFGGIEWWKEGIFTRAVLLDVPRFRGVEYVTTDSPVMGAELFELVARDGIEIRPGDAVAVYCGRDKWQAANPDKPYGYYASGSAGIHNRREVEKPGLDGSCIAFLRHFDVSTLVWDMLDSSPQPYEVPHAVHAAIFALGVALVDNAYLETLADALAASRRTDFLVVVAPLVVNGGTGSPVNPLALL